MNMKPIERQQIHEIIYEQIKKGILNGDILPGEKLNQDDLAKKLDVSRMPVRDALKRLTNDGLINNSTHKGFVVTKFPKETLLDILYVRSILEPEAVLLAKGHFGESEISTLNELYEESFSETVKVNLVRLREINRNFHFVIYNSIPSKLLLDLIGKLWDRCPNYAMYTELETAVSSLDVHRVILSLLKKGDFAGAAEVMKGHILNTRLHVNSTFE
jgi:DNA-binding GntR family transcriptional regulator